jgi:hypothetical protein
MIKNRQSEQKKNCYQLTIKNKLSISLSGGERRKTSLRSIITLSWTPPHYQNKLTPKKIAKDCERLHNDTEIEHVEETT